MTSNLLTTYSQPVKRLQPPFARGWRQSFSGFPQAEPSAINSAILKICAKMFPRKRSRVEAVARAWETGCVQTSLRDMWHRFRAMKQIAFTRLPGSRSLRYLFAQWRTACRARSRGLPHSQLSTKGGLPGLSPYRRCLRAWRLYTRFMTAY